MLCILFIKNYFKRLVVNLPLNSKLRNLFFNMKSTKKGKRFYVFLFRGRKKWPHTIYDLLRIRWKRKKVNKPNIFSCVFHDIIKALTYNKRKNPCDNNKLSWLPYARGKYVQLLFYISWLRRDVVVGVGGTSSAQFFFQLFHPWCWIDKNFIAPFIVPLPAVGLIGHSGQAFMYKKYVYENNVFVAMQACLAIQWKV